MHPGPCTGGNNFAFSPGLAPETTSSSERERLNTSASSSAGGGPGGLRGAGTPRGASRFLRQGEDLTFETRIES